MISTIKTKAYKIPRIREVIMPVGNIIPIIQNINSKIITAIIKYSSKKRIDVSMMFIFGNDIYIYGILIITVMDFDFKSILDLVKAFPDEKTCMDYLAEMRWNGDVISPFDETSKVYAMKDGRFMCKNTKKYFNAKVGTIFEDTKIPLIGSQPAYNGHEATLFIDICNAIIDLNRAGVLTPSQSVYAKFADIIVRSVAKVGVL